MYWTKRTSRVVKTKTEMLSINESIAELSPGTFSITHPIFFTTEEVKHSPFSLLLPSDGVRRSHPRLTIIAERQNSPNILIQLLRRHLTRVLRGLMRDFVDILLHLLIVARWQVGEERLEFGWRSNVLFDLEFGILYFVVDVGNGGLTDVVACFTEEGMDEVVSAECSCDRMEG